ncbi:HBL/NHE enterotoxin family protein [Haliscomenobacter hydrossis]|uniref:Hemolytic enterotoxin n=1 Tax=Haliscomenobacter hydrossis (strain ATCC 27775 / DSM 1100 / LMG 10767 / O) TaxID=760192 RepID=F4KUV7_HALH1|nr:HBL/NHE enterotoxin family protein [Haliscomenobacter hydrossis]AEE48133.1 hemolytic enterotoxin [Haliscomenobacter hydrossis DSM 1100]
MSQTRILSLIQNSNNDLAPDFLSQDTNDAGANILLMQIFANLALQQPDLSVNLTKNQDILINLKQHQKLAKRHGAYYLNTVQPGVLQIMVDLLGYSSMFQHFKKQIDQLISSVHSDPEAKKSVLALLSELERTALQKQINAQTTVGILRNYALQTALDETNFKADLDEADKVIGSDNGHLSDIKNEIADAQQQIKGNIAQIVIGSLIVGAGAVVIVLGATGTLLTAGASAEVAIGGVGVVAGGATLVATAASDLANNNQKLASLYEESAELNATLAILLILKGQIDYMYETSNDLVSAINNFNTEWGSVISGIGNFKEAVGRANTNGDQVELMTALNLAETEWKDVSTSVQKVLSKITTLKPEQVNNVLDFYRDKSKALAA